MKKYILGFIFLVLFVGLLVGVFIEAGIFTSLAVLILFSLFAIQAMFNGFVLSRIPLNEYEERARYTEEQLASLEFEHGDLTVEQYQVAENILDLEVPDINEVAWFLSERCTNKSIDFRSVPVVELDELLRRAFAALDSDEFNKESFPHIELPDDE